MKKAVFLSAVLSGAAFAGEKDGSLEIKPLAENVYLHTSYKAFEGFGFFPSNGLIVVDGNDAVLVDTAWAEEDTPRLVEWIADQGFTLTVVVVTHSHDDRASGLAYLNELNVPTFASAATNALLASENKAQAARTFENAADELRAQGIEVFFPGAGHAPDNHAVWLPSHKVLFGGCMVRSAGARNLGNTADADLAEWPLSLQRLQDRFPEAGIVVPGHGAPGGLELVTHSIELAQPH